jgi:hypothetical protein
MLTRIWISLCAMLAVVFIAAPLIAQTPGPIPNGTNQGQFGPPIATSNGHVQFGNGFAPTLNAACGTSPGTVEGTDSAFHFVSGTGTSSTCTITPAVSWSKRPTCSVDSEGGSVAYQVATNGVITLSGVADSTRYHVICIAQPGGM